MSVLTALGHLLEQHLGYVRDVHYLRLDGSVSAAQQTRLLQCHAAALPCHVLCHLGPSSRCIGMGMNTFFLSVTLYVALAAA
jgi:hypothetical protein